MLKPCPFCGSSKIRFHQENEEENAFAICQNNLCSARMYHSTTLELKKAWNKRGENRSLLGVAVRALECIHRFTMDNYARDALKTLEVNGWPVDWEGGLTTRGIFVCNVSGCTKPAEASRYQCAEHDK